MKYNILRYRVTPLPIILFGIRTEYRTKHEYNEREPWIVYVVYHFIDRDRFCVENSIISERRSK